VNRSVAFFALAGVGQIVVWVVSRFVIRRFVTRLRPRLGQFTHTDLMVTVPIVLQVVWLIALLAWVMQ
jgi:hypothetical protein